MMRREQLRRFQRIFVNMIKNTDEIILGLPMGAGKTVTILTAVLDLLDDKKVKKVLVVAPRLVATATWPDEIEDWDHTRLLQWKVLRVEDDDQRLAYARKQAYRAAKDAIGMEPNEASSYAGKRATNVKRLLLEELAEDDSEMHIINKEALSWLWDYFGKGKRWPYDMLVVDEASMFKNGNMKTPTKALTRFGVCVKARAKIKRVVLATGTPCPKGLINLWGLAKVADGGKRLGDSKYWFEKRWFVKNKYDHTCEPKPFAERQITELLSDIMFTISEDDIAEMPPMVNVPVKVTLPRKVMDEYRKFELEMVSQLYDVEAVNRGVLSSKLLQFANGSMYNAEGKDVWVHDQKLEALENIIDEANGRPVLVAYTFKFDLARITKAFKKAVVFGRGDVRETKRRWNNGDIELMVAHPASVGHGQNIQKGGNISVWYGLTPDLEIYQQWNKRLHRPGQTKTVFNHHIIAEGTYDEKILPVLADRAATQDRVTNTVRLIGL